MDNLKFILEKGLLTYFFKNGAKKAEGHYLRGQMEGTWKFYRENGFSYWQIGNFKRGIKHGKWLRYGKNAKLQYSEQFEKGKIKPKLKPEASSQEE